MERLKGTVKWFNNAKGYGFLGRDNGPDVFIHYSAIASDGYRSLEEGDKVEFEIVQGQKGPQVSSLQIAAYLPSPMSSAPLVRWSPGSRARRARR